MNDASSLKSKPKTPKTPGGISKSLLTPCRRVGLSRNWRKSVASPFNSPLPSAGAEQDDVRTRKRKETPEKSENVCEETENGTPTRKVQLPLRKKSKTLLNSITKTSEDDSLQPEPQSPEKSNENEETFPKKNVMTKSKPISTPVRTNSKESLIADKDYTPVVSTPIRLKSRSKSKKMSTKSTTKVKDSETNTKDVEKVEDIEKENIEGSNKLIDSKPVESTEKQTSNSVINREKAKSPNKLTKECIVVIQKKIFKNQLREQEKVKHENKPNESTSQALFNDSDSDEVPLNCLSKTEKEVETITIDDDDDFAINKPKLKKNNPTKSTREKQKHNTKTDSKENNKTIINVSGHSSLSQNSVDVDEDFFEKKTILIRKSYDKVVKPSKAMSTGSITQKDIDDLKVRIEKKKKMLLAQSMGETKELRELIKKWQKGCQDALMELMDLMKKKCPEQNMDYSQILQTLKIPVSLVGYDSDNDCFVTPEDENIILSHIK